MTDTRPTRGSTRHGQSVTPYRARRIADDTLTVSMASPAEIAGRRRDPNRSDSRLAFVNGRMVV